MSSDRWRRTAELFQQAIEQPPEGRESFLRKACGGDRKLRRAVEVLLQADAKAGEFLEGSWDRTLSKMNDDERSKNPDDR